MENPDDSRCYKGFFEKHVHFEVASQPCAIFDCRRVKLPRFGPGLHSRAVCGVPTAAGTAGALPAHHQDAPAPGDMWSYSRRVFFGLVLDIFWKLV